MTDDVPNGSLFWNIIPTYRFGKGRAVTAFPYTPQSSRIPKFFAHIQSSGVPPKVTQKYLESAGFKRKNDRYLISILRTLGFIDGSGVPGDMWTAYRRTDGAKAVMAAAIRSAYSGLFDMYEDAWRKDREGLRNYFKGESTGVGDTTVDLMVGTFNILCELADFEAALEPATAAGREVGGARQTATPQPVAASMGAAAGMTINVNIQLQLPATEDAAVYDRLFDSMKKHLLS